MRERWEVRKEFYMKEECVGVVEEGRKEGRVEGEGGAVTSHYSGLV